MSTSILTVQIVSISKVGKVIVYIITAIGYPFAASGIPCVIVGIQDGKGFFGPGIMEYFALNCDY